MNESDLLAALLACFCTELANTDAGAPAECCIVSATPVITECCPGFGWVRLVSAYPSQRFPAQDGTADRCRPPMWAMVVEIGVQRCAPEICGDGTGNSCCASETTAAMSNLSDFQAMRRTLGCCLPTNTDLGLDQILMGSWAPLDPSGGCAGSTMTATLQFLDYCSCL